MAKDPSCVADKEESEPCRLPKGVRTALTITGVRSFSVHSTKQNETFKALQLSQATSVANKLSCCQGYLEP